MSIIKVNYNNAAVKKPTEIIPAAFCYRITRLGDDGLENVLIIEIDARLNDETFYKDFFFEVYINDILYSYVDTNSPKNEVGRYVVELSDFSLINKDQLLIQIKGKYGDGFGNERNFIKDVITVYNYFTASDELYCGEDIICNDTVYGYYHNGSFYTERTGTIGFYEYDGEITNPGEWDGTFVDIDTNEIYEWNSNSNEYQLLY